MHLEFSSSFLLCFLVSVAVCLNSAVKFSVADFLSVCPSCAFNFELVKAFKVLSHVSTLVLWQSARAFSSSIYLLVVNYSITLLLVREGSYHFESRGLWLWLFGASMAVHLAQIVMTLLGKMSSGK